MAATGLPEQAKGRQKFEYQGRTVYEWEQSLEECRIYVTPPPGLKASFVDCKITATHLSLGIKGNPPFINEDLFEKVKQDESYWMMTDDGEIEINLQKAAKGATWPAALARHGAMDTFTRGAVQQKMMLERFQQENPGFDFSGATFNGAAPDPRTFMGGVTYT